MQPSDYQILTFTAPAYPETALHESEAEMIRRTAEQAFGVMPADFNPRSTPAYIGQGAGVEAIFEVSLRRAAVERLQRDGHAQVMSVRDDVPRAPVPSPNLAQRRLRRG